MAYGVDSGAVMAASVFMTIRIFYDQNSLIPRWSYLAASTVFILMFFKSFSTHVPKTIPHYLLAFSAQKIAKKQKLL